MFYHWTMYKNAGTLLDIQYQKYNWFKFNWFALMSVAVVLLSKLEILLFSFKYSISKWTATNVIANAIY